jgi:hypothetical protein
VVDIITDLIHISSFHLRIGDHLRIAVPHPIGVPIG